MTAPVWLVGSHHNSYEGPMFATLGEMPEAKKKGWKPLLPEYLRRRLANSSGHLIGASWNTMYVSALRALQQLDGFVSAVSFRVLEGKKDRIQFTKRDWGQIYLASTNKCVVNFSHDTRFDNRPFWGLVEWLEDPQFDSNNHIEDEQLRQYSTVDVWRGFFLGRIEQKLNAELGQIAKLAQKQKENAIHVGELQFALSRFPAINLLSASR